MSQRYVRLDELRAWLLERGLLEEKSSKEWGRAYPGCEQELYRRGMAVAMTEVVHALDFQSINSIELPEPTSGTIVPLGASITDGG